MSPTSSEFLPARPLTLWYSERSPFARRVRLALLHRQIPFQLQEIDTFQPTPRFQELSPAGLIPVLEIPQVGVLNESWAQMEWLEDQLPGTVWGPRHDLLHRTAQRQLASLAYALMTAAVAWRLEGVRTQPDLGWKSDYEESIARCVATIEQRLEESKVEGDTALPVEGIQGLWDVAIAGQYLDSRYPIWRKSAPPRFSQIIQNALKNRDFLSTQPPMS